MSNFSADHLFEDVVCLSHLRWDFVYQRPQHLMSRFGRVARVFYFEEPVFTDGETHLDVKHRDQSIYVATPIVSHRDRENADLDQIQREMLDNMISSHAIENYVLWHYTPMTIEWTNFRRSNLRRLSFWRMNAA
jgi:hypothetical protein